MKKQKWIFIFLVFNTAMLILLVVWLYHKSTPKVAYIVNNQVFEGFQGSIDLQKKLDDLSSQNKNKIDSLYQVDLTNNSEELLEKVKEESERLRENENEISIAYTNQVWQRINEYIEMYGAEKGYDVILGATGDGSLMYGKAKFNVTDDVILFINKKYSDD